MTNANTEKKDVVKKVEKRKKVKYFFQLLGYGLGSENIIKETKEFPNMVNPPERLWKQMHSQEKKKMIFSSFTACRCFGIYVSTHHSEKDGISKEEKKSWKNLSSEYFDKDKPSSNFVTDAEKTKDEKELNAVKK